MSASASLTLVINGGSSTIRRRPSCSRVNRGSARSLVLVRALATARRDLGPQRFVRGGLLQVIDVESLVRAGQQRRLRTVPAPRSGRRQRTAATADSQSVSVAPFCRPATQMLATSRRRSHSQPPGWASSKSFRSITRSRSGEA